MEGFEGEADGAGVDDVEVGEGDVDVGLGGVGVAPGFDDVPGFGEGGDGWVAGGVVLLEADGELGGAGEGNVQVGGLPVGHVFAGGGELGVVGVVSVGGENRDLAVGVGNGHAIVSTVPESKIVAGWVGEGVDNKWSRRSSNNRSSRSWVGRLRGGRRNIFLNRSSTISLHWPKHTSRSSGEPTELNRHQLASIQSRERRELETIKLLRPIKCPTQLARRLVERLKVSRITRRRTLQFNRERRSSWGLQPH